MIQVSFKEMKQMKKDPIPMDRLDSLIQRIYRPAAPEDTTRIREIVKNTISVQAALARQYLYTRDLGSAFGQAEQIILSTSDYDAEGERLAALFGQVFVTLRPDGRPMSVQVSNPNDAAFKVFAELLAEGQIDPFIRYFFVDRSFKYDCRRKAYFELQKEDGLPYFDYLIGGSRLTTYVNPLSIEVSGFTMKEIERDEAVQQLAAQVKNLYLLVYESGDPGFPVYCKQLVWYV